MPRPSRFRSVRKPILSGIGVIVGSIIACIPPAIRSPVYILAIIGGAKKSILLSPAGCFPFCEYNIVTCEPAASAM
jgi:hypothetical protein